jgi:hypothetical protein
MFHKAKTEADRQRIFDEYFLNLLKKKQNIKRHQKIIDNSSLNFDPINQDKSSKGVFNSFVDSLVIKNFLIEQLYTRLKLNKNVVQSFVNKLNSNDILIMNKTLNEYIQYIKDNYQNANDYILKNSFDELKKNYNVKELQEKNKEIIKQDQEERSGIVQENISDTTLNPAAGDVSVGDVEEEEEEELFDTDEEPEEQDQFHVEVVKDFFINGVETVKTTVPEKKIILNYFNDTFKVKPPTALKTNKEMNEYFIKMSKEIIDNTTQDDRKKKEKEIEETIKDAFNTLKRKQVKKEFNALFTGQQKRNIKGSAGKVTRINVTGSGMKQRRKMIGRGLISEEVIKADKYLKLGKYKANKEKLLGGKLQIRSENENQVNNVKSQMISKNIRDILLKINKKEIINYSDVDKLDENEKNDLYNIGKKLHITELFEIPSTLKNQEEKLKDEFFKLRGSIMAGNNSPEILKKFKMILIKMKNNKMISLSEFNEILNIFLEMDY